ncbi:MAG: transposase [Planctomycetota bacterium]
MPTYVRWREPGATYFFTVVTAERRPILVTDAARRLLHAAFAATRAERPFAMPVSVLMPDHLHCIWQLPEDDDDFPLRWRLIKTRFTRAFLAGTVGQIASVRDLPSHGHGTRDLPPGTAHTPTTCPIPAGLSPASPPCLPSGSTEPREASLTENQRRQGRRGVWQSRYWEHRIRDEQDYVQHRDYIHLNPVKHGYVRTPEEWPWSSVHEHLRRGDLAADWASFAHIRLPDFE